jgi:hypothetical protein
MHIPDDSTQALMNHGSAKAESYEKCQMETIHRIWEAKLALMITV